jgi:hypothetical protein
MLAGVERDELVTRYVDWHRKRATGLGVSEEAFQQYEIANPKFMSVDGMMRYWAKKGNG